MYDHERVTEIVGIPEAGCLCKDCLGSGSFHSSPSHHHHHHQLCQLPLSIIMSVLKKSKADMFRELQEMQEQIAMEERREVEEVEQIAREEAEQKAREEAKCKAKEEAQGKAKEAERERMAETVCEAKKSEDWKWHEVALVELAKRKAEKRGLEGPTVSGSGTRPMQCYKQQAAVGHVTDFLVCFLLMFLRARKRSWMWMGWCVGGARG
jgi:hypothetical protein